MAKTYYIFRHGQTFATKYHTGYGWKVFTASILNDSKPALARMGQYLSTQKIDLAYRSPLKRCQQTANIISSETNIEFQSDIRLGELFLEFHWQVRRRAKNFLDSIAETDAENIAICTHGAVITELMKLLSNHKSRFLEYPQPGVLIIIKEGKVELINFNKPTTQQ